MSRRVLILGGTTEATALCRALALDDRFAAVLSLAGRTLHPVLPPGPYRIGGFGGAAGLAEYLRAGAFDILIDATHPFAVRISANAAQAAERAEIPLLAIHRPPWQAQAGDRWTEVPTMHAAAMALGDPPRRVLLTVGQLDLLPFAARPWHRYVLRSVDPPPADILPDAPRILARGPFTVDDEHALLRRHATEIIVTKNSGGTATQAKLHAARALGVRVVMIARPSVPDVVAVPDAARAVAWLRDHDARLRGV